MDDVERRRYEMFLRVRDYGKAHSDSFPPTSRGGELLTTLDAVVRELEEHGAAQISNASASREHTTSKSVAREALLDSLEAIHRTALAISLNVPGLDDKFRLPIGAGDQAVLTAARAAAKDALPIKAEFTRRDMPETFLDDLASDIADFEKTISDRNKSIGQRVSATASIDDAIERGMKIAQELDAIVRNKMRNDRAAVTEWMSARHVERPTRRTKSSKPDESGTNTGGTSGESHPSDTGQNPAGS